jgi:hypothetical protein
MEELQEMEKIDFNNLKSGTLLRYNMTDELYVLLHFYNEKVDVVKETYYPIVKKHETITTSSSWSVVENETIDISEMKDNVFLLQGEKDIMIVRIMRTYHNQVQVYDLISKNVFFTNADNIIFEGNTDKELRRLFFNTDSVLVNYKKQFFTVYPEDLIGTALKLRIHGENTYIKIDDVEKAKISTNFCVNCKTLDEHYEDYQKSTKDIYTHPQYTVYFDGYNLNVQTVTHPNLKLKYMYHTPEDAYFSIVTYQELWKEHLGITELYETLDISVLNDEFIYSVKR